MRELRTGLLAAVAVGLLGTASAAWACPTIGEVVCPGTTTPAEGVTVTFTAISGWAFENPSGCSPLADITDANGIFDFGWVNPWEPHLCGGTYITNLDPNRTVTCDEAHVSGIDLTATPFEGPGTNCGPVGEDCSVGWFKRWTSAWFGLGCGGADYSDADLLACIQLRGPTSGIQREFCRQILVSCVEAAGVRQCAD